MRRLPFSLLCAAVAMPGLVRTSPAQVARTYVYNEITSLGSPSSPGADGFNYPLISRSANRIVFTETSGSTTNLWAINPDGSDLTHLDSESTTTDNFHFLSISDDGTKALIWSTHKILVVNTNGTGALTLVTVDGAFGISQARLTGDGSKVIFANSYDDNLTLNGSTPLKAGIYEIKLDGTGLAAIANTATISAVLGLSPGNIRGIGGLNGMDVSSNGSRIVFRTSFAFSGEYLMGVNGDGLGLHKILGPIQSVFTDGISEDGTTVWYNCVFAPLTPNEIGVIPFGGGTRTALVTGIQNAGGGIATDLQLTTNGSKLLFGDEGTGRLINTDGSGIVPLFVTTQGLSGPLIQATGYLTVTMDATGTKFAFTEPARGVFPPVLEIGLLTIDPSSIGVAPLITDPEATPPYILVNGGSTTTVSATVTAPTAVSAVSVELLVPATSALVGTNNNVLFAGADNLYSGSFQGGYDGKTGARTARVQAETTDAGKRRHGTAVDFGPFDIDATAPASQTITFGALSNVTFGIAPFTVTATASSGLPVTLASTTPLVCNVVGAKVTIVGGGKCSIIASQVGNTNYAPATSVTQTFEVLKPQTITFALPGTQTLGAAPFALTATASSGLAVTLGSNTKTVCTTAGGKVTLVAPGVCSITASQTGNSAYTAAPEVTREFTVLAIPQTITFGVLGNQTLGAAAFTLSATASSDLAVAFSSNSKPVCTVSGAKVTLVAAGVCSITASQTGDATHAAAPSVTRTFTVINPLPALISLSPASIIAGGSGFTLTVTGSNFVPGSIVRWNGSALPTLYVSATKLQASIGPASDVPNGEVSVTVFTPAPAGGVSGAKILTIYNPVPVLMSLSATSVKAGSGGFVITVNGFDFNEGAVVRWNGTALTTAFMSDTQLQASVPASNVAIAAVAAVTVTNPAPTPSASNAVKFTIN
jgi:hypothetical protein